MGGSISSLSPTPKPKEPVTVMVVSWCDDGKTQLLEYLQQGREIPTIGTASLKKYILNYIRGQRTIRFLDIPSQGGWRRHYWHQAAVICPAIIFVINSIARANYDYLEEARADLQRLVDEYERERPAIVLIYATRQDQDGCMTGAEVGARMVDARFFGVRGMQWHVQEASGVTGAGLDEGMNWLCRRLTERGL
ncbi:hypothetical protein BGX23_005981 [Mortierella sp. AD031]|nr:hypothetical protein BGX23_005981 [Mortierella sp. AD031]